MLVPALEESVNIWDSRTGVDPAAGKGGVNGPLIASCIKFKSAICTSLQRAAVACSSRQGRSNVCADARDIVTVNAREMKDSVGERNIKDSVYIELDSEL